MFWLKLAGAIFAGLVVIVGAIYAVGSALPREHKVVRRLVLKGVSMEAVWARIGDAASTPAWRKSVSSVKRLADRDGHAVWAEVSGGEMAVYETSETAPPRLLVRKVVDQTMYGGTWRIELATAGDDGVAVSVTEDGWVDAPVFRALARFVFGYASAAESYLSDLAASFGEAMVMVKVEG